MIQHEGDEFFGSELLNEGEGFVAMPYGSLKRMKDGIDECILRKGMKETGKKSFNNYVYARHAADRARRKQ